MDVCKPVCEWVLVCVLLGGSTGCGGEFAHERPERTSPASLALKPQTVPRMASIALADAATPEPHVEPLTPKADSSSNAVLAPEQHTDSVSLSVSLPIEDPTGQALAPFHAALRRAQSGEGQARIVVYGASHTASDLFTGELRWRLQQRFGDSGAGFVMPAKPWRWYRNACIDSEQSRGFRTFRIKARKPLDGIYGLAGVALDARADKPAVAVIVTRPQHGTCGQASRAELYFLKQPGGGHLSLAIDDAPARKIATASNAHEAGYSTIEIADGPHRFTLRTAGDGPVRIFGLALERDTPGVRLDTLGIPGTRARDHLFWDDTVYREHLARRRADLIVLAYGTNEVGDDDVPSAVYERHLARVLTRIREVAPSAACLLVGPSDRPLKNDDESFSSRPLTDQIIESQRRMAVQFGCGFFDLRGFMGGSMAMLRWVAATPPLGTPDHVHFTALGYTRLGEVLYDALLAGFEPATAR